MTAKELFEAVGLVDDDLVLAADAPAPRRRAAVYWRFVPLAACLCLAVGIWRSDGELLGDLIGLVMPRAGSAAPAALSVESSAEASAASSAETSPDFSERGDSSPAAAEAAPEEEAAAYDSAKQTAGANRVTSQECSGVPMLDACPIDATGYDAWYTFDTGHPAEGGWEVPAGALSLFTQNGEPFVPDGSGIWTIALEIEAAEGTQVEAGYATVGGAPVACYEGPAGEVLVTARENADCYFYLVIQGEGTALVSAVPAQAVRCPVTPAE